MHSSCHNPEASNMKQIRYTKQLDNLHNNSLSHSLILTPVNDAS